MDYETSPAPETNPPRKTEERIPEIKAVPRPQMPPFVNRHEPAVEGLQRRGHLLPSEWDVRFDRNNQPIKKA